MMPFLTATVPGTGGRIKETPDDFRVTEIPLYLPCGEGEHLYVTFEKRGITTLEAIRRLSRATGVPEREIGYAGLKDAQGVTRQTVSLPRVDPAAVIGADISAVTVLSAIRHRNKLRVGHLQGNAFRIVIRGVDSDALQRAEEVLGILSRRGVPNYFGEQRYGAHGSSHLVGRHMLAGDDRGAVDALIGTGEGIEDERWRSAVEAFRAGNLEETLRLLPGHCRTEREVVRRLATRPDDYRGAVKTINPRLRSLFISACQSWLFDQVVARRIDTLDTLIEGDIAMKHDNGACFDVADPAAELPRVAAGEISPTGPLFGTRMKEAAGAQRRIEEQVVADAGLSPDFFRSDRAPEGTRRPLRVFATGAALSADGTSLIAEFSLPKGSYATTVLREITKTTFSS